MDIKGPDACFADIKALLNHNCCNELLGRIADTGFPLSEISVTTTTNLRMLATSLFPVQSHWKPINPASQSVSDEKQKKLVNLSSPETRHTLKIKNQRRLR